MASNRTLVVCAAALMLAMAVTVAVMSTPSEGAVSCGTVSASLAPCISYLTGKVAAIPASCCPGVKKLYTATKSSRPDRVTACKCIVSTAKTLAGLRADRVASLAGSCGVNLGYSPSVNTNCASIP